MGKKPTSIDEQIDLILSRTGESNEKDGFVGQELRNMLNYHGYDNIIYRFENLIYIGNSKKIKKGIKVRELINLFYFDREILGFATKMICYIELFLKSQMKISISKIWEQENKTLKPRLNNDKAQPTGFISKKYTLKIGSLKKSRKHYVKAFGGVPTILSLIDGTTMGEFSDFIVNNKNHIIIDVFFKSLKSILKINKNKLNDGVINFIEYFRNIRNLVFHNHSILGAGDNKTYTQQKTIFNFSNNFTNPKNRTKNCFFPLRDLLIMFKKINEKDFQIIKSNIKILYWRFLVVDDLPFLDWECIIGGEFDF